jgi:hypothetical protein
MQAFSLCGGRLFLALLVGALCCTSCDRKYVQRPHPLVNHPVKINACKVTPKWFPAHALDTVTWTVTDTQTYLIKFGNKTPLDPPLSNIPSMTSALPVTKTVKGDGSCINGHEAHPRDCYFDYKLYAVSGGAETPCGDPGIHMVN